MQFAFILSLPPYLFYPSKAHLLCAFSPSCHSISIVPGVSKKYGVAYEHSTGCLKKVWYIAYE